MASRLYGVRIEAWKDAPTWHESVQAFRMKDGERGSRCVLRRRVPARVEA
ncbi:MAG: hypothetical protein U0235_20610 [Polyangiaceae bacterium]